MARKTIVQLVDDLDKKELNGDGQTVTFGFQSTQYEIDLSTNNVKRLQDALAPFMAAARRVGARQPRAASSAGRTDREQLQAMRHWAKENGYPIRDRGRVSREVQDAYNSAH